MMMMSSLDVDVLPLYTPGIASGRHVFYSKFVEEPSGDGGPRQERHDRRVGEWKKQHWYEISDEPAC